MEMSGLLLMFLVGSFVFACEAGNSEEVSEITVIKNALAKQAKDIETLKQTVDVLTIENVEQTNKLAEVENENKELRKQLKSNIYTKTVSRNGRLLLMDQELTNANHYNKPAFTAKLSQHQTSIGNQQPIVFDSALTNVGNGYSTISGVFTVPANGTYFFFASILSHYGDYVETEIVLNGNEIAPMYSSGPMHDQGTNGVVVNVKINDLVWVRHRGTEGNKVYGYNWSSFTGFQL